MSQPDRLYDLLPAVYRARDEEQGFPLRALLQIITEQVTIVENDIWRLYDNWFIETCEDWVVPYIADLVGYDPLPELGVAADPSTPSGAARNRVLVPRAEVATLVRSRRRKGTLALLELLADAVAGLPGRAVEFYRLLAFTQSLNHQRPERGQTLDLRNGDGLDLLGGPFESAAHTADLRRIASTRTPGRYNLPSVGVFVWRLRAYSVTRAPAHCLDRQPNCYTFSILGNSTPLFNRPRREEDPSQIASELNVPAPIRRRAFGAPAPIGGRALASADYYGPDASVMLWTYGWPEESESELAPMPRERVLSANLSDFAYAPPAGYVAVDPVLGRIAFPIAHPPDRPIHVSYCYGFSADMGGGEYPRELVQVAEAEVFRVSGQEQWEERLKPWQRRSSNYAARAQRAPSPRNHVIEITDSGVYDPPFRIEIPEGDSLEIRAANGVRPILFIPERRLQQLDDLSFTLGSGARLTLDGLLIVNRSVTIRAAEGNAPLDPCRTRVVIRHCTLVPGWLLDAECHPLCPSEPSLVLFNLQGHVDIDHSIVGSIQVEHDEVREDPLALTARDSILDATGSDCETPDCEAVGRLGRGIAHVALRVERCTVIGRVRVHAIELAEDSIFTGRVRVARSQLGCMRFCYVPTESRTPKRYQCQPDNVLRNLRESPEFSAATPDERAVSLACEQLRVRPEFESRRYGTPTYCQLASSCAIEILRGASDESQLGAFHDSFEPQRTEALLARLNQYTPAAADVGIIFAT